MIYCLTKKTLCIYYNQINSFIIQRCHTKKIIKSRILVGHHGSNSYNIRVIIIHFDILAAFNNNV